MSCQDRLPTGWATATLGEVLPIAYGKGLTKAVRNETGDIPVFGSSGEVGRHDTPLTEGPAIIIGRKGTVGAVYYSPTRCWPIDTVYFAQGTPSTNLQFLSYLLGFLQLGKLDRSTAVPGISRDDYNVVTTNLPPLPEQHRIVEVIESYLTRLDDAVATLERVQRNLKRYRASVLKAAVEGRVVPTEAELAREEGREYEPASVLLERILKERRHRWIEDAAEKGRAKAEEKARKQGKGWTDEDNAKTLNAERSKAAKKYKEPAVPDTEELPELPEGWCWAILPSLLLGSKAGMKTGPFGTLLKKHEHRLTGVPVIGIENIDSMRFVHGSKIHITEEKAWDLAAYDVQPGDLLISRSGTVGEVCVFPDDVGPARLSTNVMRVRFLVKGPVPAFFTLLINGSPFVTSQISELCKGTTRDFLNQRILSALVCPLPPLAEQQRIVDEVARLLSVAEASTSVAKADLIRFHRLRQSILKWAFEGKLVDQDPEDEPASVLLERIKTERAKMEDGRKKTSKRGRKRRVG